METTAWRVPEQILQNISTYVFLHGIDIVFPCNVTNERKRINLRTGRPFEASSIAQNALFVTPSKMVSVKFLLVFIGFNPRLIFFELLR